MAASVTANDDARAQKTNAGDNTLDHATRISHVGMTKCSNRQGRTQSNQSECANPRRLSVKIAVESEEHTDQSRCRQPKKNIEYLHDGTLSSISDRKQVDAVR